MDGSGAFTRIVVGVDGTETAGDAARLAAHLAADTGATLHLVSAWRASVPVAAPEVGVALADVSIGLGRTYAEEALEDTAAALVRDGLVIETWPVEGPAADALLGAADRLHADLIVVGNRRMRGAARVLGSVASRVTHHANCHVLVAHTT